MAGRAKAEKATRKAGKAGRSARAPLTNVERAAEARAAKSVPARPSGSAALRARAAAVHERFLAAQPAPRCELEHRGAWDLLVATILSAQSTDKMVNRVLPQVMERFPTPAAMGAAPQEDVEAVVKSTGFFRNKAKAIREAGRMVAEQFGGEVPRTMEEITRLPGVARKTANVVLGTAYGLTTGITVDTHALRVSRRLGLTTEEDPEKVEQDLMRLFPPEAWIDTGHRMVLHGRYVCTARAPRCAACPLNEQCPSAEAEPEGSWQERAAREKRLVESHGEAE